MRGSAGILSVCMLCSSWVLELPVGFMNYPCRVSTREASRGILKTMSIGCCRLLTDDCNMTDAVVSMVRAGEWLESSSGLERGLMA